MPSLAAAAACPVLLHWAHWPGPVGSLASDTELLQQCLLQVMLLRDILAGDTRKILCCQPQQCSSRAAAERIVWITPICVL